MQTWFATASIVLSLIVPEYARGQESTTSSVAASSPYRLDDYCERVREAGKSTAAVLLGPRVGVQAIKFPAGGDLTLAQTSASETQLRGYTQYSFTDAYHGILALKLGEAECRRERLAQPLEDAIRAATDQGRREALSRELQSLREHDDAVAGLERDAEARQRAQVGTVEELIEIQTLSSAFRSKESETEEELGRLDASALHEPTLPLSEQATEYERATLDVEQLGSRIRQVAPWTVSVSGGVAANSTIAADWFGTLELSYNLGGLAQGGAEHRLLSARERELESASYELVHDARVVDAALGQSLDRLSRQIAVVEKEIAALGGEEALLEGSDAPARLPLLSVVKLRRWTLEGQLVYSRALAQQRRPWESSR